MMAWSRYLSNLALRKGEDLLKLDGEGHKGSQLCAAGNTIWTVTSPPISRDRSSPVTSHWLGGRACLFTAGGHPCGKETGASQPRDSATAMWVVTSPTILRCRSPRLRHTGCVACLITAGGPPRGEETGVT